MPKVIACTRRIRGLPVQSEPAEYAPHGSWRSSPRQVSFEDGHQSSSSFSTQQALASANTSSSSLASTASCKASLQRKAPSVCLVGLAESQEDMAQDQDDSAITDALHCLSPMPSADRDSNYNYHVNNSPRQQPHGQSTAPSSPWGHFVDLLVPLDEEEPPSFHDHPLSNKRPGFFGGFVPQVPDDEYLNDASANDVRCFWPNNSNNAHRPVSSHKRHKHRRCSPSPHPYGLLPRHHQQHQRRRNQQQLLQAARPSFLPGFFLEPTTVDDRTIESSEATHDVQEAMERLQF
jgi:hypothetical protein